MPINPDMARRIQSPFHAFRIAIGSRRFRKYGKAAMGGQIYHARDLTLDQRLALIQAGFTWGQWLHSLFGHQPPVVKGWIRVEGWEQDTPIKGTCDCGKPAVTHIRDSLLCLDCFGHMADGL